MYDLLIYLSCIGAACSVLILVDIVVGGCPSLASLLATPIVAICWLFCVYNIKYKNKTKCSVCTYNKCKSNYICYENKYYYQPEKPKQKTKTLDEQYNEIINNIK